MDEDDRLLRDLRDLSKFHPFITWRDRVIEPNIKALETELASDKADNLPEVVLRAKLKHLNSLKYLFKEVFEIAAETLENTK